MIAKMICNYLNYMLFIETASPNTLIAYKNDLLQAFPEISSYQIINPSLERPEYHCLSQQLESESSQPNVEELTTFLLGRCRQAQVGWKHLEAPSRNRKASCLKSFLAW